MKIPTGEVSVWIDPDVEKPPGGVKMILFSRWGCASIGNWYDGAIAWAPFPKIPPSVRVKMGTH